MQLWLELERLGDRLVAVDRLLRTRFGQPGPWHRLDPVSQLVLGLVGGRTREADSLRAFEALANRYRSWSGVRDAPEHEVRRIIRAVTYADAKASNLKGALQRVTALRGELALDFLRAWPVHDALAWLERLPGVGRKTSAVTLNFSTLGMRALVLDTHHLRVLRRLEIVSRKADTRRAYDRIVPRLPPSWGPVRFDDHHQLMKRLGQRFCHHGTPSCAPCPLARICPSQKRSKREVRGKTMRELPRTVRSPAARALISGS